VSYVSIAVPAENLDAQRYAFELDGVNAAGRRDPIATYAFQLDRR
jgi:hypothetical protein